MKIAAAFSALLASAAAFAPQQSARSATQLHETKVRKEIILFLDEAGIQVYVAQSKGREHDVVTGSKHI